MFYEELNQLVLYCLKMIHKSERRELKEHEKFQTISSWKLVQRFLIESCLKVAKSLKFRFRQQQCKYQMSLVLNLDIQL